MSVPPPQRGPRGPRTPGPRYRHLEAGRSPRRPRRGALTAIAAVLVVAVTAAVVWATLLRGAGPDEPLGAYLAAWSRGDDRAAARLTDRPEAAAKALEASRRGLDGARVRARELDVRRDGDTATARVRVDWQVPRIGEFGYETTVALADTGERWELRWAPGAIHPQLEEDTRLGTAHLAPDRGDLLDRDGAALMTERAVMDVAVEVDEVRSARDTARRIAALLEDVEAEALERRIEDAGDGRFIPVITLRMADFRPLDEELRAVPGISLAEGRAPLAPTRSFGRAVLGAVGPITAEQLEELGGRYGPGDEIGQYGLQARFERRLAGTTTSRVVIRSTADGSVQETLLERAGRDGRSVRTTLDRDVQRAAEAALGDRERKAALVVVQPSTGDVLAVANRPLDSSLNRAFEGLYPPGSTFKVVSTAALLRDGLDIGATVACPPTRTVEGKSFRNFEGEAAGDVPFRVDFAQSCNTAFVGLADRLEAGALPETAKDYGLGQELELALPAAEAKVPRAEDAVGHAAMMIGQDRIVASPLAMAGVAAAVADGRWRAPRLVADDPRRAGDPLPDGEARTLRELMAAVVDEGTGTALAGVSGDVGGKSGTAEYGSGDPPPTHAWFVAFRDDLALSVLVEGGSSGGAVAAPLAARFFAALDGGT